MVIGIRLLKLRNDTSSVDIPIKVLAPEKKGSAWICRFEIGWPEGKAERWGTGGDAIEALFYTLQMIGIEIYGSDYHKSGRLSWLSEGTGYGFPVTKNIRDALVGDDKRYL